MYVIGNTNKSNFELFVAVGECNRAGVPLAYLLIKTTKDAPKYAKEKILVDWLGKLKEQGVNPEFTLSDKDWSEINAMKKVFSYTSILFKANNNFIQFQVWPKAKHQLCFWHELRAIKQRLSKNKDTPAFYDVQEAQAKFSFIKADFKPYMQQDNTTQVFLFSLLY